ncbi:hypothetical protein GALMADRAFT_249647 [Galerina marginata CBS 339.88]|uniref:Uncharacterized protein n=1 Tax=Galerina marginata (strain CBS 339.88) TaxID=685588 RepID=A0A067T6X2_GALM3|nr:hypothetical protein GALMADRAFT_249647 [Galerina marginata CBS 339.88]
MVTATRPHQEQYEVFLTSSLAGFRGQFVLNVRHSTSSLVFDIDSSCCLPSPSLILGTSGTSSLRTRSCSSRTDTAFVLYSTIIFLFLPTSPADIRSMQSPNSCSRTSLDDATNEEKQEEGNREEGGPPIKFSCTALRNRSDLAWVLALAF